MKTAAVAWIAIVGSCGGSGAAPGPGADPRAVVRGFVEAMAAGDLDRARRFLPDEAACAQIAAADQVAACKASATAMRAQLDRLGDDFPRGAKVVSIEKSPEPMPDPSLGEWMIVLAVDGARETSGLLTILIGKIHYAAFAVRRDP
jgi:hypothetical protein